ncbi:MAG: hypothetical protein KDI36_16040 [Pseudomonadales bacterium]|nr:hypothetical protein [Pseudomonadales bacterium]
MPLSRHANCGHCFEVLHCCRACEHFNERAPAGCEYELADPPVIKESANFCEFFRLRYLEEAQVQGKGHSNLQAKSALDNLFGDAAESSADSAQDDQRSADDPARRLDDLFGD